MYECTRPSRGGCIHTSPHGLKQVRNPKAAMGLLFQVLPAASIQATSVPGKGSFFLALLAFPLADSINRINALRQVITLSAKAAATGFFIFSGHIVWPAAIVMAAGSL